MSSKLENIKTPDEDQTYWYLDLATSQLLWAKPRFWNWNHLKKKFSGWSETMIPSSGVCIYFWLGKYASSLKSLCILYSRMRLPGHKTFFFFFFYKIQHDRSDWKLILKDERKTWETRITLAFEYISQWSCFDNNLHNSPAWAWSAEDRDFLERLSYLDQILSNWTFLTLWSS